MKLSQFRDGLCGACLNNRELSKLCSKPVLRSINESLFPYRATVASSSFM